MQRCVVKECSLDMCWWLVRSVIKGHYSDSVTLLALDVHVIWLYAYLVPRVLFEVTQHVLGRAACCHRLNSELDVIMSAVLLLVHVLPQTWKNTVLDVEALYKPV